MIQVDLSMVSAVAQGEQWIQRLPMAIKFAPSLALDVASVFGISQKEAVNFVTTSGVVLSLSLSLSRATPNQMIRKRLISPQNSFQST